MASDDMAGYTELKGCPQPPKVTRKGVQRKGRALMQGPKLPRGRRKAGPLKPAGLKKQLGLKKPHALKAPRLKKLHMSGGGRRKGSSWLLRWLLAKAKSLTKAKSDFRNHGFTGSGKKGLTGRAGGARGKGGGLRF